MRHPRSGHFTGGEWRYDANHNQLLSVTNAGQKPTAALLTLHYDNGQKRYEMEQTIQPGDQMWMNLAELFRNRVADRKGNTLPPDVTFGTYDVKDLSSGFGTLTVGGLALDTTYGYHSRPPSPDCCAQNGPLFDPDSYSLDIDQFESIGAMATDQCTGDPENILGQLTDWVSGNSGIATVTRAQVTGVAAGTTTANASGQVIQCSGNTEYFEKINLQAPITVTGVPINFRQTSVQDMGSGNLKFTYQWNSSTGNLADLAACTVGESVSYPGNSNFNWTSPPYDTSGNPTSNPTVGSFPGSDGGFYDNNTHPGFLKPYVSNSFTATQLFQHNCGAGSVVLIQNIALVRTVQQIQGVWTYTLSKSGSQASTPLP